MLEHRRNGWYLLGGSMITGGMAWLAAWGVAVASSSAPNSLHFLDAATYIAAGIVVVGLLVVLAVMYDWLTGLTWLFPGRTGLPLKVVAGSPHFHDWNYAASVVALPIVVANRTNTPVVMAGGCRIQGNMGDLPSWEERITDDDKGWFLREIESQKRSSHHRPNISEKATIPAHASLEFWYVTDVSRNQHGVHLDMTLHFEDDDGNKYAVTFQRIQPKPTQTSPTMLSAQ